MKKVTPATMVDHIEPITKENWEVLFLDKNNLQSLCWGCHYAKTNWDKVEQKFDKSGKDLMDDILSQ